MRLFLQKLALLLPVLLVLAMLLWQRGQDEPFPGLRGPDTSIVLPLLPGAAPEPGAFAGQGQHAVALLVTDPASSWYGLASGLRDIGVPVRVVDNVTDALAHQVVFIYPLLSGATTSRDELQQLAIHVRAGGTLLAFGVLGGGLEEIFGFGAVVETGRFQQMQFQSDAFTETFARAGETIRLGAGGAADALPGLAFTAPKLPPVAVYEDGSAAITRNVYSSEQGQGRAFAVGIDIGHFVLRAHNGRLPGLADTYVNGFQPKLDTLLRFLAEVYRQGEPFPVLLSPTPDAREVSILLTHDIDFTASIDNMLAYARLEQEAGVPATYFIQTKYVTDFNDERFFSAERFRDVQELQQLGMEVASHSVAHSNEFRAMPVGTGAELYPDYQPFVQNFTSVRGATIAGELRISRYLLEALGADTVQSFRPGHLSLPETLPQMLAATGYRYSSSITANEALTHLPFRMMHDRGYAAPVAVYEFPVTIEDEEGVLGERLDEALALTRAIAAYRGLVTVLVHTEVLDHKFAFVRDYIAALRDTAWFGTVSTYGQWWAQRETVTMDVIAAAEDSRTLRITVADSIAGLTLELPAGWVFTHGPPGTRQQGTLLSVGAFDSETELGLQRQ